ncbi:MAG: DUF72 domain-containing protein [Nitrososphaerota archaeon]
MKKLDKELSTFYRGLIIVHPYGTYIRKKRKTIIVKTKFMPSIVNKIFLLIENKRGLGFIVLGRPTKINLSEFAKLTKYHLIGESHRLDWWPKHATFYSYPITNTKFFRIPLLLEYPRGPQITIRPSNIFIKKIFVGISGYYYPQIYPRGVKDMLEFYTKNFNSVEINSTFYKFPSDSLVKKLEKYNLIYTFKVHRYITHTKRLKKIKHFWKTFYEKLKPLHHKIVCFLFQFNLSFKYNRENFERLQSLSRWLNPLHRYAFEFRDLGWMENFSVQKLFEKNGWTLVISHLTNANSWTGKLASGFNPPLEKYRPTSDTIYIRMHGSLGRYIGSYSNRELRSVVRFMGNTPCKYIIIYFNNTDSNRDAFNNALTLKNKVNYLNLSLNTIYPIIFS